jgi:hypothetical protein
MKMETNPMLQSFNIVPQVSTGWFTFERRNWVALVICAALAGFGLGNGHTTQGAIATVSDQLGQAKAQIPKLAARAGCEKWRADVSANLAKQSNMVDPSEIPADHCPKPANFPPAQHGVPPK